jgi:hypothetical protein
MNEQKKVMFWTQYKGRWIAQARKNGLGLIDWIIQTLNRASEQTDDNQHTSNK